MRHLKIYLGIILSCSLILANAQDFRKDFVSLSEKSYKAKQVALTLHYNLFLDNDFSQAFEERDIKVVRSSPCYLHCTDVNSEFISNKEGVLFINHQQKQIILKPQADKIVEGNEMLMAIDLNFDTLMMLFSKVNYKKLSNELIEYECLMKGGIYKKIKMVYNTKTKLPEKAIYFHRKPIKKNPQDDKFHSVVVEVVYRNFNFQPTITPIAFSHSKYISRKDKQYKTQGAYSSYQFINLFEENNYESEE